MNAKILPAMLAAALMPGANASASPVRADHLDIEVVSETTTLVPGKTAWLGLVLRHEPHWHTYWINPGDSGLPTRLKWTLPPGFTVDDVSWPAPSRFEVGGLFNFGYAGEQLLPIALHVPADAKPGDLANLSAEARWLICREECITGKATLAIKLPIALNREHGVQSVQDLFAAAREAIPKTIAWNGSAGLDGNRVTIRLLGEDLPSLEGLDVFAVERRILENAPAKLSRSGDTLLIEAAKNDYFGEPPSAIDLVLTRKMTNGGVNAWQVRVPFEADTTDK